MPLSNEQKDALLAEFEAAQAENDTASMAAVRDALARDRAESQTLGARIASNARAAVEGFTPGLLRSPEALLEGTAALGADIAVGGAGGLDELMQLWTGRPTTFPLRTAASEARIKLRGVIESRRMADEVREPGSVDVADVAAGLIPLPFGKVKDAQTLAQAVRRGSIEGATAANLSFQTADDRVFSTAAGLLLPSALQAVGSFRRAVQNQVVRFIRKRADPATNKMLAETRAAFVDPTTGQPLPGLDDYLIAQATGDPRLARLAAQSADVRARDITRTQFDTRIANVKTVLDNLRTKPMNDELRAEAIFKVVKDEHRMLRGVANKEYEDGFNALRASPEGQAMRVPLKPIRDAVTELERDMGDILGVLSKSSTSGQLGTVLKELKLLKGGNVRELKLEGLEKLQKALNAGRTYGLAAIQPEERAANLVRTRLQQSIQETVASGPDTEAFRALRQVQQNYARRSDAVRRLEDDELTNLFGDKSVLAHADTAFDKFIRLSPGEQSRGVQILGARSPEHLAYFRQRYLNDILDKATAEAKQASQSTLNVEDLFQGLTSKELLKNPLFTEQEKIWARAAAKDIRVIMNSNPDVTKPGTDLPLADFAINIVSQTPAFMARLATRAVTGLNLENILFSKQGRMALSTVANLRTANQKRINMATGYFLGLLASEPQPQAEDSQQEQVLQ